MKLTVLIPTYRRANDLRRCLEALARQLRLPDEVIAIAREDDGDTRALLQDFPVQRLPLRNAVTGDGGTVAALNQGLQEATGDVIAILDDDTAPWPDWLQRVEGHFLSRPMLGGLGGRDITRDQTAELPVVSRVGRVLWYGRWIGQAHRGYGAARPVDLLKGCNMSFRRAALAGLAFDARLRGKGAQWFNDSAISLAVQHAGWEVWYDPAVLVDHYHGPRQDGDARRTSEPDEVYDVVFNETLTLMEYLPALRRQVYMLFGFLVGQRRAPGLVQWARAALTGRPYSAEYQLAAWRGRRDAWRLWREGQTRGGAGRRRSGMAA